MLPKKSMTLVNQPTLGSVASQANVLHINASAASGMTYSPEGMVTSIKSLFGNFFSAIANLTISDAPHVKDIKVVDRLAVKLTDDVLIKRGSQLIPVQDGLQVNLELWLETLAQSYENLDKELTESLESLLTLFGRLVNDPDEIRNLSKYGSADIKKIKGINETFQSMFGSSQRTNRITIAAMIPNEDVIQQSAVFFKKAVESRAKFDNTKIKADIARINELADKFIADYGLRIANNRRAVSDLSAHINGIAEAVSMLSLVDYSFQVAVNTVNEISKKI